MEHTVTRHECPSGYTETTTIPIDTIVDCGWVEEDGCCGQQDLITLYRHFCQETTEKWVCRSADDMCDTPIVPTCMVNGEPYTYLHNCEDQCKENIPCRDDAAQCNLATNSYTYASWELCEEACKEYKCALDDTAYSYGDWESCFVECSNEFACNTQSEDYRFKVTIRNQGDNDYLQVLDLVEPEEQSLGSAVFEGEEQIARQCLTLYMAPFTDFEDPSTGAHFSYSETDLLLYQKAAEDGLLPRDDTANDADSSVPKNSLPIHPPTYRAGSTIVPNVPQFPGKQVGSSSWVDEDVESRVGVVTAILNHLNPLVYYYECPEGLVEASATNSCGGLDPFGGVDETIKGSFCFQNRCDATAIAEPLDRVYSGCSEVSDMEWQVN